MKNRVVGVSLALTAGVLVLIVVAFSPAAPYTLSVPGSDSDGYYVCSSQSEDVDGPIYVHSYFEIDVSILLANDANGYSIPRIGFIDNDTDGTSLARIYNHDTGVDVDLVCQEIGREAYVQAYMDIGGTYVVQKLYDAFSDTTFAYRLAGTRVGAEPLYFDPEGAAMSHEAFVALNLQTEEEKLRTPRYMEYTEPGDVPGWLVAFVDNLAHVSSGEIE